YEYYIKERIKILQNGYNDKWLNILEDKIVEVGNEINMARNNIINIFNDLMFTYNFDFPKIELSIENNDFNDLRKKLLQNRQKDRETKRTNDGVHKSDLKLFYKSKNIFAEYCSTGEQKLFLISLTLLRVFVGVEYKKGSPIVLLDEVFSYLDDNKKRSLFNELNKLKIQTFITTNNVDIFKELLNENVNLINLE
ncbi:MAG: hypothetical protein LBC92_03855, partial [Rickettsiales bacterium]|nr:hypothetical protein [Rickettsiales bacterium]